jgi:tetratricopeptide (TPR) repeat protein
MHEIFVGRQAELEAFAKALPKLIPARNFAGLFRLHSLAEPQPRLFLISGGRGLGKRRLLNQFEKQCQAHPKLKWVGLEWGEKAEIGSLPRDFSELLLHLYTALGKDFAPQKIESQFQAFVTMLEKRGKVQKKVTQEESKPFLSSLAPLAGDVAGALTPAALSAINPALAGVVAPAVPALSKGVATTVQKTEQWLRQILSEEEYRLYANPNEELAAAFVSGLVALAETAPFVLAQAKYELVATLPQGDALWRALVVKEALEKSPSVAFVLVSRRDFAAAYRETFAGNPSQLFTSALQPFTASEIQAAYDLDAALSLRIQQRTGGVPAAVEDAVEHWKQTGQELTAAQDAAGLHLFRRYLIEAPEEAAESAQKKRRDRQQLYALALLRQTDAQALAVCWGALTNSAPLSAEEVFERLHSLRRDYEFLFAEDSDQLLPRHRQALREYLRQIMQPAADSLERETLRQLNAAACEHYRQLLTERTAVLPNLEERTADEAWRVLALNVFNHQLWLERQAALTELAARILEAAASRTIWLDPFWELAQEFDWQGNEFFQTLHAGAKALFVKDDDWSPIDAMWSEIEKRHAKWPLAPLHQALLADRLAGRNGRQQQWEQAAEALTKGLQALPAQTEPELRAELLQRLTGCAALLMFEQRAYEMAVTLARRVLQFEPQHAVGQQLEIMAVLGQKDYASAEQLLNQRLAEQPNNTELLASRWHLHRLQNRPVEAIQDLRRILELRPDWGESVLRLLQKDASYVQALTEWQQDSGVQPAEIQAFAKLQALPSEAQLELLTAILNLLATEKPTPQDLLRVRQMTVQHLPNEPEEHVMLGLAYLNVGQLPAALAAFAQAQQLAPDNPAMVTVPALNLFWHGYFAEALPLLEASIQALPEHPGPQISTLACLLNLGRIEEAKTRAEAAILRFENEAHLYWLYGLLLTQAGELERGWRMSRRALRANPTQIEADYKVLHLRPPAVQENVKQAIRAGFGAVLGQAITETLVNLAPEDFARLAFQLTRATLEVEEFGDWNVELLLAVLAELVTLKPESASLRLEVAAAYEHFGHRDEAIALLEEIVEKSLARQQDLRQRLGMWYAKNKDWKAALRHFREMEEPLSADEYFLLASVYLQDKQIPKALATYDKALALAEDPDTEQVNLYGWLQMNEGNYPRAEAMFRSILARQSDEALVAANLAEALYCQQRYDEAQAIAEQALQSAPDSPWLALRLFRIHTALGRADEAAQFQQQALQNLSQVERYDQAAVLAELGQTEEALDKLAEELNTNATLREWLRYEYSFRGLHVYPAFQKLLAHPNSV